MLCPNQVHAGNIPTPPLSFTPEAPSFGADLNELELTLTNEQGSPLARKLLRVEGDVSNPEAVSDSILSIPDIQPSSGTLDAGEQVTTYVMLERSSVSI